MEKPDRKQFIFAQMEMHLAVCLVFKSNEISQQIHSQNFPVYRHSLFH